jgi:hypothetical protein
MKTARLIVAFCMTALFGAARLSAATPASTFALQDWKLDIPGPKEIKELKDYSSDYFQLNPDRQLCFHLDASEKGSTPNSHYVRSELRHLPNWTVGENHQLTAELKATFALKPEKLTVLQIHGMLPDRKNAPPLLRVAYAKKDLVAILKTDNEGKKNENIILLKDLGDAWVKIDVVVESGSLKIRVNDEEKLNRNISYWEFPSYFKAGCYPQATEGTADVTFRKLEAK